MLSRLFSSKPSPHPPLIEASKKGNLKEIERRVKAGENPDLRGTCSWCGGSDHTPLIVSACFGHAHLVDFFLAHGVSVDGQNSVGRTALMCAASNNHTLVCHTLLLHKANVDLQDNDGCTALHIACDGGHYQTVSALLTYGGRTDIKNKDGMTPLDIAHSHNWEKCAEFITHAERQRQAVSAAQ
eukprot:TRINITY_DN3859_c0_g1_i1.p1 TRINITY_DN3859_c0_g1~~TRINITY_DN3859_c0_g1_i1.p1  ORF type:complete len:184 (-),score=33.50 TRINITY_DN3859_c0_g1_i1:9-560(-)